MVDPVGRGKEVGLDIGRAIQYWMKDPKWITKVLIGGLLSIIPIVGQLIVGGYYIRTVQQIQGGNDSGLPEWGQWGDDLVRGLKLFGIVIVWLIPLIAISICVAALSVIDETAGGFAGLLLNCLGFIYIVAFYFIFPILIGRFAATEQFSEGFQFGPIINDAQKIPSQLLIFLVMWFVVSFVAGFGIILCGIGILFTSFIAYLISGHLVAQISTMLGYGGGGPQANTPPSPPPPPPQSAW
jgi:hypothetical protein